MIDADDRAGMEETVRGAMADALATAGANADIDAVLAKLGWLEMLAGEPDDAIDIVFSALGFTNATATALDDVLASALGRAPHADLAVLLPPFAAWDPPGRIDGNHLEARGLATARAATSRELLVVCGEESKPSSALVPTTAAEVQAVRGVDPAAGLRTVRARSEAASVDRSSTPWQSAVALGRRAVAHQIAGSCRAMLDLARTHALTREQFGRPIARFQAVRHRLAEALVAVEALDAALTVARDEAGPETAALAKAIAGRTAHTVARHCQQVLAGIGFTAEHPFQGFLKRTLVIEGLFGSARRITLDVGRRLLAERRVPTLIDL